MDGRKHTTIEIGGEIYNLRVSYNAMCEYIRHIGPMENFDKDSLIGFRGIVWAGINACGNRTVTIEEAGDLCEQLIRDIGQEAFGKKMKSLVEDSGWLGDDTRKNRKSKPKLSPKSSKSTETLPLESAD